ncbi:hypothetical protein F7731_06635 [Cytobacillus depressus]|uniref:DUF5667 domain-containing protein n=1 Tax=Cytobacillus depressus TaxID=1602942 RepID=A0A6L3V913_9BACI|nr:DUF5667 domain-containing protein [Cytobacillus depressus]KAB2337285.1 hypothetical protein F7731_06635 [Cytobacillus depressus]
MKFLSNKELNKVGKATLALVLAGTFTFSTIHALAAEDTTDTKKFARVNLENLTQENTVQAENIDLDITTNEQKDVEDVKKPSLLPGSFFYFAKITLEKVKLALTLDQEKEAKLLAEFASERLAEAEALLVDSKEEEALKVIEKAIENLTKAEKEANDNKNDTTNEEPTKEDSEKDEQNSEQKAVTEEEPSKDKVNVKEKVTVENSDDELQQLISQNIIALKAAMEKVKNPVAKAALQKNIEKSYAKLAKKIEKLDKKYTKEEKSLKTIVEKTTAEVQLIKDESAVNSTTETVENKVAKDENATVPVNTVKEQAKKQKQENKAKAAEQHAEAKKAHELAKQHVKQIREEAKTEIKQIREIAKQEAKQAREEVKQQKKEIKEARIHQEPKQKNKGHEDIEDKGNGKN